MEDLLSCFSNQPGLHDWCNKGCLSLCHEVIDQLCRSLVSWLACLNHSVDVSIPFRAGCSSVDSVPAFEAVGRRIDPSQWTQVQFGLFSVPTSGPQLVYQRPWYVLFCLWKSAYKRSLAAYRKE